MIVPVLTALLNKGDLIDARNLEALEMRTELLGRADPARSAGLGERGPCLFISRPDIGLARLVLAENIVVCQRIAEECIRPRRGALLPRRLDVPRSPSPWRYWR